MNLDKDKKVKLTLVQGVAGLSLYLNDHRIAGEKPWGGGEVIKEWFVPEDEILDQLKIKQKKPVKLKGEGV